MRNLLIYDLPTRVLHWAMAACFAVAFLIANTVDDESPVFLYHMLAGLLLAFSVILRLIWGLAGTRHARFGAFVLRPADLAAYFTGMLSGKKTKWAGHNPASSWAAIVMFGLALGLSVTGYWMATGHGEAFEDIHELLANAFLLVVFLHIAGLALHQLRHRDKLALAMVDGKKSEVSPTETISQTRPAIALLFTALLIAFALHLVQNVDIRHQTLTLLGIPLTLGDAEDNGDPEGSNGGAAHEENHDDD